MAAMISCRVLPDSCKPTQCCFFANVVIESDLALLYRCFSIDFVSLAFPFIDVLLSTASLISLIMLSRTISRTCARQARQAVATTLRPHSTSSQFPTAWRATPAPRISYQPGIFRNQARYYSSGKSLADESIEDIQEL